MAEDERATGDLPPDAVVVRAGEMASKSLKDNAVTHHKQPPHEWALSVACYPSMSAREIALCRRLRNRSMRVSTVAEIESAGFEVVADPDDSPYAPELHALIMLPIDPSDEPTEEAWEEMWDELRDCFGEKEPNPAYEMFRG